MHNEGGYGVTEKFENLLKILKETYDKNPFVTLLEMNFVKMEPGSAILEMPVVVGKHTNLHGIAHGGALASLADTAMGAVCATFDKKVVTLNMNMSYIKAALSCQTVRAVARVIHNGRSTMVVESEVLDKNGELLAKATGSFYVVGDFSGGI